MKILKEFREFAVKGNVVDLAIGVVIGGAFGKITTSLVGDVIMPAIGILLGKLDFSNYFWNPTGEQVATLAEAKEKGIATLNYGLFLTTVLDFLIIAFAMFFVVRTMNRLKRKEAPAPATTRPCPDCLSVIPKAAKRCAFCGGTVPKVTK